MMATMRSLPRAGDPASMTSIPEAIFHHTTRDTNFPDKHWKGFTSLVVRWRNRNSGGPKNFFFPVRPQTQTPRRGFPIVVEWGPDHAGVFRITRLD
jgi:hypothetical protein